MKNIVDKTLEILNANDEWQQRYVGYLFDIWNNQSKIKKGFRKPEGLSIYTTVGDRNTKTYYLRFKGQNVGKVKVTNNGINLKCITKESDSHEIKGYPMINNDKDNWHSKEASNFRSFFRDLSINTQTKSQEHYVESSLLKEFGKRNGNVKVLKNIQPVRLHRHFFQMPTPLKATSHVPTYAGPNGGGIDILARIKTIAGHNRLCVIEVKDENKPAESQKDAMTQAISYATFIARLLQQQPDWMEFFSGHESKTGRLQNALDMYDIDVITLMPTGKTETFEKQVLEIPGTLFRLHCHSLYYDKKKFEESGVFDFSGTFLDEIKK